MRAASFFLAFSGLVTLAGCGSGGPLEPGSDQTHVYRIENRSPHPITATFDAYYAGYCDRGTATHAVSANATRTVFVTFKDCVNGGGEEVGGVSAHTRDGTRLHVDCSDRVCRIGE